MVSPKSFAHLPSRWRLSDQPLPVQFLAAGGIVALFSVISLSLLLVQVGRQASASRWLSQTHRTIGQLNTLGRDYYRQQTAAHEFMQTGDARTLATILEGRQFWEESFRSVRELVKDDQTQLQRLERVGDSYRSWLQLWDGLLPRLNSTDSVQKISRPRQNPALLRDESALFKQTFLLIDRMIDWENRQLEGRDRQEKGAVQNTFSRIAIINVALLLIFGVVLAKLYVSIARPISDLSRGIRKYQDGDFRTRVLVSNKSQIGFLEASFNEMAEKIEAMVADLRKLDELKTEFLSTVSHELRTPLTSIGGYAKLLINGDAGTISDIQKEFLLIVDTNVVRLTNLINDILDVEKMESGRVQLDRSPQELNTILRDCKNTFEILAKQKGLELRFSVPEEPLRIVGDHDRLVQIFMNLLSNSIKYTKAGYVELSAEKRNYAVVIKVRDTGIGLSADDQEKLFQKFYRARSGLSSGEGGTGLGLVIVRGLVEAHGGSIKVESRLDEGTVFTVTLPLPDAPVESASPASKADAQTQHLVWVIDGRAADATAIKETLLNSKEHFSEQQLQVEIFRDVGETPGRDQIKQMPSLVLLDPDIRGGELMMIPQLRQKMRQSLPIVVVGASVDEKAAFAEGASACIGKPVRTQELLDVTRRLLTQKSSRILLADGNTDLRLLLKRALEQKGFHVDDVERGHFVLGRLEQEQYDLILIDHHLPDISARELIKIIREAPRLKETAIFLMSVESKNVPSPDELSAWGANQFVAKYRGLGAIVNSVRQYLEQKR